MNGELYQLCRLTAEARSALFGQKKFDYKFARSENSIRFLFAENSAGDPSEWYEGLVSKGLRDIKLLTPYEVRDRNLLGFSNNTQSCILCRFVNGETTAFIPEWSFDGSLKKWNITYREQPMRLPEELPRAEGSNEEFRAVLVEIEKLAREIGAENFAETFARARGILDGELPHGKEMPPKLSEKDLAVFCAASTADVFGAMGSWNDSPPYMAHEKGLDAEYDELSAKLLRNIRQAVSRAVNS